MQNAESDLSHNPDCVKPSQETIERFWAKVNKYGPVPEHAPHLGECWQWTATISQGRARFRFKGGTRQASRVVFELEYGDFDQKFFVLHHCDNGKCVRPSHLFLGTQQDNISDMVSKGRNQKGDRSSSRLHPESRCYGDKNGSRTHPESLMRGENHVFAKLTAAQAIEIKNIYAAGGISQRILGGMFGIAQGTVSQLVNGRNWKHLSV